MRRIVILLILLFANNACALAQNAPDMFEDVPKDHWAYAAVESLRSRGILIGYPDGYFRGKRTLTRYEFAVALDRALQRTLSQVGIPGPQSPPEPRGPQGPPSPQGRPGISGPSFEEIAQLRRLMTEFRNELAALGNNTQAVSRRLDQLARDVAEVRAAGDNLSRLSEASTRELRLGLDAAFGDGTTLGEALGNGDYKNLFGGSLAEVSPRRQGLDFAPASGPSSVSLGSNLSGNTYFDLLELKTPFRGVGRGSNLTIGRFNQRLGRHSPWGPIVDPYRAIPWHDDGSFRVDGARLSTSFGSLAFEAFSGLTESVQGSNSGPINSHLAGVGTESVATRLFNFNAKPIGQTPQGQLALNQLAGLSLGLGVRQLQGGHIRLSALELAGAGGSVFNGVHTLGADVSLRLTDRLSLMGDWSKTITPTGRTEAVNPHFNNAFNAAVQYDAGSLNLSAGYRYIDPNFYAPAYWGRIGNWLNPTNVQGPTVRAAWDISPRLAINVGGEVYSAARDRAARGGLGENDTITRALVGIRWNLSRSLETTLDWEGVYWQLDGAPSLTGGAPSLIMPGRAHPTEQYFTLGTGYSLTNNARLRFLYQIGTFDGNGLFLNAPGLGARNTFNVFTGQVAVRF